MGEKKEGLDLGVIVRAESHATAQSIVWRWSRDQGIKLTEGHHSGGSIYKCLYFTPEPEPTPRQLMDLWELLDVVLEMRNISLVRWNELDHKILWNRTNAPRLPKS